MYAFLQILFIISGIILIILILLRKSEVGGLSSAFGGMGDTAFGVKGQKQLDKVIIYVSTLFILVAVFLNMPYIKKQKDSTPTTNETPETPDKPADGDSK